MVGRFARKLVDGYCSPALNSLGAVAENPDVVVMPVSGMIGRRFTDDQESDPMPTTFKLTDDEIEGFTRMRAKLADDSTASPCDSTDDPTAAISAELAGLTPDKHRGRDYHYGFASALKIVIDTLDRTEAKPELKRAYLDLMLRTCEQLGGSAS